jgi:tRNA threonylcarbamoyladenosine biosynthesis protein TsaE
VNRTAATYPTSRPEALVLVTTSADQTRSLAGAVAPLCLPGDVLLLAGDLGAGKTAFAQGFGAGLGITDQITSPTFTLVRSYPVTARSGVRVLLHADVYRLDYLQEIVDLGLGELIEDDGVALVEWGDAAEPVLGDGSLTVRLDGDGVDTDRRVITVTPGGDAWSGRWTGLIEALAPWRADR